MPLQRCEKRLRIDGLGDVVLHSRFEALFGVALHGVGGHGNNGNVRQEGPDTPRRFDAVQFRHLDVHEDHVVGPGTSHVHGFEPVGGHIHRNALHFQDFCSYYLVDIVILGEQDPEPVERCGRVARRGAFGLLEDCGRRRKRSVKLNVDPLPTTLRTWIVPPMCCTSTRAMARPRPVPP